MFEYWEKVSEDSEKDVEELYRWKDQHASSRVLASAVLLRLKEILKIVKFSFPDLYTIVNSVPVKKPFVIL